MGRFLRSLRFALAGLGAAWRTQANFRIEVVLGLLWAAVLIILRPAAFWWAASALVAGLVLAAELLNTALEALLDRLHPEPHPAIKTAKDCAAAAVLVLALASLVIAALTLASVWPPAG